MWGYPLWLFLGLWLLLTWPRAIDRNRLAGAVAFWTLACVGYAGAFIANYAILPHYDDRERAVMFSGERLSAEILARFRAATGTSPAYVIGTMWTAGNISHYAAERPRVLIDGDPRRAPWIDMADLRAKGAVVVWSYPDATRLPDELRPVAANAQLQPPFALPFHRSDRTIAIGWAILPPEK
jgi:hypothetical protein